MKEAKIKKVNKIIYALLTILFGSIGINKFYAGKIKAGIISLLFCWTFIPFVLSVAEFITVLTIKSDKEGKITLPSERITKVKFIVSLIIFTLFIIGSIIPWESIINKFTVFTEFNKTLSEFKLFKYNVFSNIIGTPVIASEYGSSGVISAFGSWQMLDISIFLIIVSAVIGLCSGIKFDEIIKTSNNSVKKILPISLTVMLLSAVLIIMVTSGLDITIANAIIKLGNGFNLATSALSSVVGSVISSDFYYYANRVAIVYTSAISDSNYYGVIAFIMQSIFYIMMIIAPTSVSLVAGLYYLNIPYNKWLKYIWKVLLAVFAIVLITAIIIYVII